MKYPYKQFPADLNNAFPNRHKAIRPVIPVQVTFRGKSLKCLALVDSGADFCIFHAEIGAALGVDIEKGQKLEYTGVEGNKETAFFHNVQLCCAGGTPFEILIGFSRGFDGRMPYPILGQQGFFEHYKIIFDYIGEEVELRDRGHNSH